MISTPSLWRLVQLFAMSAVASSFAFPSIAVPKAAVPKAAVSKLQKQAEAQTDVQLHIRLDVTDGKKESWMAIDGPILALEGKKLATSTPLALSANVPKSFSTSGIRSLRMIKPASYVTMDGAKTVKMENGCWEIVWRDNSHAGSLVFSFNVPEDAVRNNAKIPKCRMFVSFPLYTKDTIHEARAQRENAERRARKHEQEKKMEIAKMNDTNNLLAKAMHYRNAFTAMEKHYLTNISSLPQLPTEQEIIPLHDDLLMSTRGKIWKKAGAQIFEQKDTFLGNAKAMSGLKP